MLKVLGRGSRGQLVVVAIRIQPFQLIIQPKLLGPGILGMTRVHGVVKWTELAYERRSKPIALSLCAPILDYRA